MFFDLSPISFINVAQPPNTIVLNATTSPQVFKHRAGNKNVDTSLVYQEMFYLFKVRRSHCLITCAIKSNVVQALFSAIISDMKNIEHECKYSVMHIGFRLQAQPGQLVKFTPKVIGTQWTNSCETMGIEVKRFQNLQKIRNCNVKLAENRLILFQVQVKADPRYAGVQ